MRGRLVTIFGISGSVLGILAGSVELGIGARIRPWIGNKDSPAILGATTILLSGVALTAVLSSRTVGMPSNNRKLTRFLGVLLPAAICFTTVGRLWYLPGSLLLVTALLLAADYWIDPLRKGAPTHGSSISRTGRVLGLMGSSSILASIGLGFFKNGPALFSSSQVSGSDRLLVQILPMDLLRQIPLMAGAPAIPDIEVTLVMFVYVLLILGAALAFFASLGGSRLIMGIGGSVALAGLILFVAGLPWILVQASLPPLPLGALLGSLGWGFRLATAGAGLTTFAGIFRFRTA